MNREHSSDVLIDHSYADQFLQGELCPLDTVYLNGLAEPKEISALELEQTVCGVVTALRFE